MLHSNLNINEKDHLEFAGVDAVEMAKKYGTPLYLMDEDRIRDRCREYIRCMHTYLGETSHPLFASKACSSSVLRSPMLSSIVMCAIEPSTSASARYMSISRSRPTVKRSISAVGSYPLSHNFIES